MRFTHSAIWLATGLTVVSAGASAQSTTEDRLREALRSTTVDLRAAQDAQVTLQAQLDQAQKARDALQAQVTQLSAQAAQQPAAAPAAPAAPVAPAGPSPEEQQLREAVETLKRQNAGLQVGLQKWQAAYQQAAGIAQAKDAEGRQFSASLKTAQTTLGVCENKNTRLIGVANEILHLYRTQSFRSLLWKSYEPLLGFEEVKLENIVQDNEDRIRAQQYYPGEQPPAPQPAAAKAPAR